MPRRRSRDGPDDCCLRIVSVACQCRELGIECTHQRCTDCPDSGPRCSDPSNGRETSCLGRWDRAGLITVATAVALAVLALAI